MQSIVNINSPLSATIVILQTLKLYAQNIHGKTLIINLVFAHVTAPVHISIHSIPEWLLTVLPVFKSSVKVRYVTVHVVNIPTNNEIL
jgi:hypothetical protein